MDYQLNNRYFKEAGWKIQAGLIALGLILFLSDVKVFGIIVLLAGAGWLYYNYTQKVSDADYDANVAKNLEDIRKRALTKLGIDEDEVREIAPIQFEGYDYSGATQFRKGADGVGRTNLYETVLLFFSSNEVHCYHYKFNTVDASSNGIEMTDVYFYPDVVTVSTNSETRNFTDSATGKPVTIASEEFVLRTSGGNTLNVSLRDAAEAQRSINAMRQLLRQKKNR